MKVKSIAILSLDNLDIQTDSRVLRQIKYLNKDFLIDVIAFGKPGQNIEEPVRSFHQVGTLASGKLQRKLHTLVFLLLGKLFPKWAYERWYWNRPGHKKTLELLNQLKPDAVHANDWWTLPVAAEVVKANKAQLIFDAHEYAIDEYGNQAWWRIFYRPVVKYFINKYLIDITASVTVSDLLARRLQREMGLLPVVVMNAPELSGELKEFQPTDPGHIRIVHHGTASPYRHQDLMIDTMRYLDERFALTFMLFGDRKYIKKLQDMAFETAPGRIQFCPPVSPKLLISELQQYDLGIHLLPTENINFDETLPNKIFEFIAAGLPVVIGPAAGLKQIVEQYHIGVISPSFDPKQVAKIINRLNATEIDQLKQQAHRTRLLLNAEIEMKKLIDLYTRLFNDSK